MAMADDRVLAEGDAYTQLEHFQALQPPRERGSEAGSALIASFAIVAGISALWFAPFLLGFTAIGLAVLALAVSGRNDRVARAALAIATVGWLVGSVIAIILDRNPMAV